MESDARAAYQRSVTIDTEWKKNDIIFFFSFFMDRNAPDFVLISYPSFFEGSLNKRTLLPPR
jgi:hypothetical protein